MSLPRSLQEQAPAGPAQAAGLRRRAQSLPAVRRPRHTVTAFVSPSSTSAPPRSSSPHPAAATVVEAVDLVEFVRVALDLAKLAHDGIRHRPASAPRREPPAASSRRTDSTRRAAPETCAARSDTVPGRPTAGRSNSGLSTYATECRSDSKIPPQQPIPPSETPSAAHGTAASHNVPFRALSRCWDHSLEQLHVAARLSAVRPARRQKLQSSID